MVFALLIAAIIWNLGTWFFGLPASSSHTMVGSIIGVGIANQLMSVKTGTSGVDWGQATNIGKSLLLSPLVGFVGAALLLLLCKALIPNKQLYEAPKEPSRLRSGFARCWCSPARRELRARLQRRAEGHGPHHAHPDRNGANGLRRQSRHYPVRPRTSLPYRRKPPSAWAITLTLRVVEIPGNEVTDYIRTKNFTPNTMLAMRELVNGIGTEMALYKDLKAVPQDKGPQLPQRYVCGEAKDSG